MKIINVCGARPNFMKIAPLMRAFASRSQVEPFLLTGARALSLSLGGPVSGALAILVAGIAVVALPLALVALHRQRAPTALFFAGVVAVFSVISGVLLGFVHQNVSLLVVRSAASSDAAEE